MKHTNDNIPGQHGSWQGEERNNNTDVPDDEEQHPYPSNLLEINALQHLRARIDNDGNFTTNYIRWPFIWYSDTSPAFSSSNASRAQQGRLLSRVLDMLEQALILSQSDGDNDAYDEDEQEGEEQQYSTNPTQTWLQFPTDTSRAPREDRPIVITTTRTAEARYGEESTIFAGAQSTTQTAGAGEVVIPTSTRTTTGEGEAPPRSDNGEDDDDNSRCSSSRPALQ